MSLVRPLTSDDPAIGGKARSLARLRELGLPVPAGFALASSLAEALAAAGPPPPVALRTAADLDALEAARDARAAASLPAAWARALDAALTGLDATAAPSSRFAVRSSAAEEDRATGAAPGIFESIVPVARDAVAAAVARVLGSALSPAAWTTRRQTGTPASPADAAEDGLAVLIHRYVEGTAHGAASALPGPRGGVVEVALDAQAGAPSEAARARITAALTVVVERFGASEIEWTASGDDVTFLQLRPFHPGGAARFPHHGADDPDDAIRAEDGWIWDAAHNPDPLSPAQAGLVALVDEGATTGLRQKVIDGYLCFERCPARPAAAAPAEAETPPAPGALLAALVDEVDAHLSRLGPAPPLAEALDVYARAYERLFGVVQPACARARAELVRCLEGHVTDPRETARALTAGVPSAATRRAALSRALATAVGPERRQAALDAYLAAFGDESPRWDVAWPTLRETPERLLLAVAGQTTGTTGSTGSAATTAIAATTATGARDETGARDDPAARALSLAGRLPTNVRPAFETALSAARAAAAVGEDDDALFARLQALVRRALLALGKRLVVAGRLQAAEDVFFLPLPLARALDTARSTSPAPASSAATDGDLPALVAAARRAYADAAGTPPWSRAPGARSGAASGEPLVRGRGGAPGRAIGRVAHHPSAATTPLDAPTVLVAATLLPTELPLVAPVALVVETGTILGHVAAQARERGIPAVVGVAGARAALPEGTLVVVDGTRGEIIRLVE